MIILEWLTTYLETSKMDMTAEIELLGLLAILILASMPVIVTFLIMAIAEYRNKKGEIKNDNTR